MSDIAIKLENISKQYRLGVVGTGTLSHDLNRWWAKIRKKEDKLGIIGHKNTLSEKGGEYVWALRDINIEVKKGQVIGIIGKNGAGKSTLLKLLSRVTGPTTGSIKVNGRIASLLEVGTGFHPELTGKENVFLNGAILGMTKKDIKNKLEEIVEFAGIAKYIDTPVKRYSSGMYVRLAFSVAAHLEPDILVVDEVLAVGDAEFQRKAIGKMKQVSEGGKRTVLFVSHNMVAIKNLCETTYLMEHGTISKMGNSEDMVREYLNINLDFASLPTIDAAKIEEIVLRPQHILHPTFNINKITVRDIDRNVKAKFKSDENIYVDIEVLVNTKINELRVLCELVNEEAIPIITSQASDNQSYIDYCVKNPLDKGLYKYTCEIPKRILGGLRYYLTFQVINVKIEHHNLKKALFFDVEFVDYCGVFYGNYSSSFLRPEFKWELNKTETDA